MDSGGPKEACVRWGPDAYAKGQYLGNYGERTYPFINRVKALNQD